MLTFVTCYLWSHLQLNYPDGHVEILEKYQKYCNIFQCVIKFEVLLWFISVLGKLIIIWASLIWGYSWDGEVEGNCDIMHCDMQYNCRVLLLSLLYWLFIYASKYFLIDHICKTQSEFSDFLEKGRIY